MISATILALAIQAQAPPADSLLPPPVTRELRAVWVATVNNLDWPSRSDLSTGEQQQELLAILDRSAELGMNAIIFQVRPVADAFYASPYEPWSRYLTGRQGRKPDPYWDPLRFAVSEAHKRGLELHAWFNPYRAAFGRESLPAKNHVSQRYPRYVVPYGRFLWMDPGISAVRRLMIRTVLDVVRRYDVDGVHIDDYFYPYPENDAFGRRIEFPDSATHAAYRRGGGKLDRADWRRNNVNMLLREFYSSVKAEKKWVKVGISPFGIWRPANPPSIQAGIDQYDELFADPRKWMHEGWLDYLAPQLYWPIDPPAQSYPVLLQWWVEQNLKGRHVWPGLPVYKLRLTGPRALRAEEIARQIRITRETSGATGHIVFNAKVVMENVDSIADKLASLYAEPALVPASPWLDRVPPPKPRVRIVTDTLSGEPVVRFAPSDAQVIRHWVLQTRVGGAWRSRILPGVERTRILKDGEAAADLISVAAVDRAGNISAPALVERR
jgi:uncharacterized lipoprotein YddW (UPF0748 family)